MNRSMNKVVAHLGEAGDMLIGFGMFAFIQTTLFWTDYMSYVLLCKQLYHMKITFTVFS